MARRLLTRAKYPFDQEFYVDLLNQPTSQSVQMYTVLGGEGFGFRAEAGQTFRFTMIEAAQCLDVCVMNAHDPTEHFASGAQAAIEGGMITRFTRIWGSPPASRPLATCIADTVKSTGTTPGLRDHASYGGHCNPHEWILNFKRPHRSCYDNLWAGMVMLGFSHEDIHDNLNLFQKTAFDPQSGAIILDKSDAEAGDYIEFYAEIDLAIVLSSCPYGDLAVPPRGLGAVDSIPVYPIEVAVHDTNVKPQEWRTIDYKTRGDLSREDCKPG